MGVPPGGYRMSARRIVLYAVVGALTLTAALAIAILLFGRFGETEGRILGTTIFLACFGLLALPAAILLDQRRLPKLAAAVLTLSAAGFALATAGIWMAEPPTALEKLTPTVVAFGVAATQTAALAGRRREPERSAVRALFLASTVLVAVLASLLSVAIWADLESQLFFRAVGAGVVLDVLLVALQPILAALSGTEHRYVLHLSLDPPGELEVAVGASRLSRAVARAIEGAEAGGASVVAVEVVEERPTL